MGNIFAPPPPLEKILGAPLVTRDEKGNTLGETVGEQKLYVDKGRERSKQSAGRDMRRFTDGDKDGDSRGVHGADFQPPFQPTP